MKNKNPHPWWRFKCNSAMNQVQLLAGNPRTGHMTSSYMASSQVTKTFTSITSHRTDIEPWASYIVFVYSRHIDWYAKWPTLVIHQVRSFDLMLSDELRSGHLTWPKIKFSNWLFGVTMHMVRYVSMVVSTTTSGNTMVFRVFSICLSSKVIRKNVDFTKKIVWPGLGRSKFDQRKIRVVTDKRAIRTIVQFSLANYILNVTGQRSNRRKRSRAGSYLKKYLPMVPWS